jgi:hypothetical protein
MRSIIAKASSRFGSWSSHFRTESHDAQLRQTKKNSQKTSREKESMKGRKRGSAQMTKGVDFEEAKAFGA